MLLNEKYLQYIYKKFYKSHLLEHVKKNTEWKRKYQFYGHSTVSKVEFDNYFSILFMMFVNGAKGSAENNWSKDPLKQRYIKAVTQMRKRNHLDWKQRQKPFQQTGILSTTSIIQIYIIFTQLQQNDQYIFTAFRCIVAVE
ncbi:Hypothetical_protein [Hexamita inflata]|uniref:Hypothetical_protein n=1 Tax=Hexamita inflata TaxID=28002 RepID=A0AA86U127_9EUKA|nr:Hypothetical protein HINF_LOCUS25500 [Hexamita inflata]